MRSITDGSMSPAQVGMVAPDLFKKLDLSVAGTIVNVKVPDGARFVNITSNGQFYMRTSVDDGTGLAPLFVANISAVSSDEEGAEFNPGFYQLEGFRDKWISAASTDGSTTVMLGFYL